MGDFHQPLKMIRAQGADGFDLTIDLVNFTHPGFAIHRVDFAM
jgi:hypothetical protein